MELTLTTRLILFAVILIAIYFGAKHFLDIDILEFVWLTIVESIKDVEWSLIAFITTIVFTAIMLTMIWKSPLWVNAVYFDTTKKLILSVLFPIVAYPISVRAWNK